MEPRGSRGRTLVSSHSFVCHCGCLCFRHRLRGTFGSVRCFCQHGQATIVHPATQLCSHVLRTHGTQSMCVCIFVCLCVSECLSGGSAPESRAHGHHGATHQRPARVWSKPRATYDLFACGPGREDPGNQAVTALQSSLGRRLCARASPGLACWERRYEAARSFCMIRALWIGVGTVVLNKHACTFTPVVPSGEVIMSSHSMTHNQVWEKTNNNGLIWDDTENQAS